MIQRRSVAIIGTGNVCVAAAYALFNQRTASEIILFDINEERARGEAMDLTGRKWTPFSVRPGMQPTK